MRDIEATPPDAPVTTLTNHAMLVVWGHFGRGIGLVKNLEETPIPQRKRVHTPQTKLIEFLLAILGGCAYLQDISHGPHPLAEKVRSRRFSAVDWSRSGRSRYYEPQILALGQEEVSLSPASRMPCRSAERTRFHACRTRRTSSGAMARAL